MSFGDGQTVNRGCIRVFGCLTDSLRFVFVLRIVNKICTNFKSIFPEPIVLFIHLDYLK